MTKFIYNGIYYPVIGEAAIYDLYENGNMYTAVIVKKLGGYTGFWSFLPYVGIKCKVNNKKPYRQLVMDAIKNHPEMRLEKSFGSRENSYVVFRKSVHEKLNKLYIGNIRFAYFLTNLNSLQGTSKDSKTVSVGYNPKERKWYGWSHRAKYGFGIGSTVKKGDIAYVEEKGEWTAKTLEDAKQMAIDFAENIA
jgi:hypothetical protein